jgi:protein SCO1/2
MRKILIYSLLLLTVLASCKNKQKRLPFLQQDVSGKDTTYRTIPEFKLLNQDSAVVTRKDLNGAIYVADFFFLSFYLSHYTAEHVKDLSEIPG